MAQSDLKTILAIVQRDPSTFIPFIRFNFHMTLIPGIGETGPLTGPLVLGFMLSCTLFGIIIIQVDSYYNSFLNDKMWLKWLVGVLFTLEIIITICTLIDAWAVFGSGWGNVNSLLFYDWSLLLISLLNGAVASVVQFFFAYRIFKLTNSIWLPAIICAISLLQYVILFYGAITNAVRGRSFEAYYQLSTIASIPLIADAVCDILIATTTVIIIYYQTSIRLSVETGLITASFAIVELVLWQAEKFSNYHYILGLVLGRLYSNAMMAALNSRAQLENHRNINTTTCNFLTLFQDEYPDLSPSAAMPLTSINIMREVDIVSDPGHELDNMSPKHSCSQVHGANPRSQIPICSALFVVPKMAPLVTEEQLGAIPP